MSFAARRMLLLGSLARSSSRILKFILYSDPHVYFEKNRVASQLETVGRMFDHHIADGLHHEFGISLGDYGSWLADDEAANDAEAPEILAQYARAPYSRAYYYQLMGNHDAGNSGDTPAYRWWRKWIDPAGENPSDSGVINAQRPYPIIQLGAVPTYLAYAFSVGNLIIIMMGDNNAAPTNEAGRGAAPVADAYSTGGWSETAWNEVVSYMVKNSDRPIIFCAHHAIRDTTCGSSFGETDIINVHPADPDNPGGEGYVYAIGTDLDTDKPHILFSQFQGLFDVYFHGHTHLQYSYSWGGKGRSRSCYGSRFIHDGQLTKFFVSSGGQSPDSQSNYMTFDGTNLRMQVYNHAAGASNSLALPVGIAAALERNITMKAAFARSYSAPVIAAPSTQPTSFVAARGTATSVRLSWTGNSSKYLVIQRSGAAPTGSPSNGTVYRVGDTIGDGTVAFMGNQTEVELYGLTGGTTYHWKIFAFNSGGNDIKYNTTSALSGSHTVAASSLFLYEEVPFNIFNSDKWTEFKVTNDVTLGNIFMLADSGKVWLHGDGIRDTNEVVLFSTIPNSWRSKATVTSGLATLVFTMSHGSGQTSNNLYAGIGIYNADAPSNIGSNSVARMTYFTSGDIFCGYRTANTSRSSVQLSSAIKSGTFKITIDMTTGVVNFYQWSGSAWTLISGPLTNATSILAPGTNMKVYMAVEDRLAADGFQDVYFEDIYFGNADMAGITP